jgi:hypothetical protein
LTNQPCEWERLQFPVRLAYAITINKSQAETLAKLGVWLVTAVFGRGQICVAKYRTGMCSSIFVAAVPYKPADPFITVKLVYRHILDYSILVLLIRFIKQLDSSQTCCYCMITITPLPWPKKHPLGSTVTGPIPVATTKLLYVPYHSHLMLIVRPTTNIRLKKSCI